MILSWIVYWISCVCVIGIVWAVIQTHPSEPLESQLEGGSHVYVLDVLEVCLYLILSTLKNRLGML